MSNNKDWLSPKQAFFEIEISYKNRFQQKKQSDNLKLINLETLKMLSEYNLPEVNWFICVRELYKHFETPGYEWTKKYELVAPFFTSNPPVFCKEQMLEKSVEERRTITELSDYAFLMNVDLRNKSLESTLVNDKETLLELEKKAAKISKRIETTTKKLDVLIDDPDNAEFLRDVIIEPVENKSDTKLIDPDVISSLDENDKEKMVKIEDVINAITAISCQNESYYCDIKTARRLYNSLKIDSDSKINRESKKIMC